jgi:hypothetical protein
MVLIGFSLSFTGKGDLQQRLDHSMQDVNDKFHALEETEKNAVRTALIEERSRFCHFITCLKPVVVRGIDCSSKLFLTVIKLLMQL